MYNNTISNSYFMDESTLIKSNILENLQIENMYFTSNKITNNIYRLGSSSYLF